MTPREYAQSAVRKLSALRSSTPTPTAGQISRIIEQTVAAAMRDAKSAAEAAHLPPPAFHCAECNVLHQPKYRRNTRFCSPECSTKWHAREHQRRLRKKV